MPKRLPQKIIALAALVLLLGLNGYYRGLKSDAGEIFTEDPGINP
jgi:hypothetical protein